jgi:DNA repair protein RadC
VTATWIDGPAAGATTPRHHARRRCAGCDRSVYRPGRTDRVEVTSPEVAAELVVPFLSHADREVCIAAFVDTKHRLLDVAIVSVGSLDHTFMAPREVFRDALLANAAAVVLAHNHPSGDPEPSRDDELLARRLARAGEVVGVDVLDSLVVGGDGWVSLARRGVLASVS